MLAIVLIAVALGLSNVAASIGLGMSGVDNRLRRRIAVTFGFFEAVMPLVGLVLGRSLARSLGAFASHLGGVLLIVIGVYAMIQARRDAPTPVGTRGGLVLTGAALSIDNLVVGFALGAYRVNVVLAAVTIAMVSVGMSLVGLELGGRLGTRIEHGSAEIGAAMLMVVGVAIALRVL